MKTPPDALAFIQQSKIKIQQCFCLLTLRAIASEAYPRYPASSEYIVLTHAVLVETTVEREVVVKCMFETAPGLFARVPEPKECQLPSATPREGTLALAIVLSPVCPGALLPAVLPIPPRFPESN